MAQVKFTSRSIPTLPVPASGRAEYFDIGLPGFGLRVSPEGRRTWIVRYRVKGRSAKGSLTLGTFPNTELAAARDAAKDALRQAEKGVDPGARKRKERGAETFKELTDVYLEQYAKKRKRSWKTDEATIKRDLLPVLGTMKAIAVARSDVRDVLRRITAREAPIMANRTLELMRTIFNWAIAEEIAGIEHNPCYKVPRPAEAVARDRVLGPEEIATLWGVLERPPGGMPHRIALALRLQLVTGQRKGEIIAAAWAEIDLERDRVWTIPAEKAKNGLAHRVPLSESALELLGKIKKTSGASRWLFPSPAGDRPIAARGVNHALARIADKIGVSDLTPHDLRRTAASHMTGMGISRLVVSHLLNHVERGITAVYDRHSYDPEKRAALEAWARRLEEIVSGEATPSNVVKLQA